MMMLTLHDPMHSYIVLMYDDDYIIESYDHMFPINVFFLIGV